MLNLRPRINIMIAGHSVEKCRFSLGTLAHDEVQAEGVFEVLPGHPGKQTNNQTRRTLTPLDSHGNVNRPGRAARLLPGRAF